MFWKKTLGEKLYNEVLEYIGENKLSISTLVRLAVIEYIKK